MKKYHLSSKNLNLLNPQALHALVVNPISTAHFVFSPLDGGTYGNIEVTVIKEDPLSNLADHSTLVEYNFTQIIPYKVKQLPYVRVGSIIVITGSDGFYPLEPVGYEFMSYFEAIKMPDSQLMFGISRVQQNDFDDPFTNLVANPVLKEYIFE